jgi:hypothetical protein
MTAVWICAGVSVERGFCDGRGLISDGTGGTSTAMLPLLIPVALVVAYRMHPAAVEALFGLFVFWRLWLRWKYY